MLERLLDKCYRELYNENNIEHIYLFCSIGVFLF